MAAVLLAGASGAAQAAVVQVRVDNVLPGQGHILVSLCKGSLEPEACTLAQSAEASARSMVFTFPAVEPGVYAVAAFQDLDGNNTLNRSRNGLPLEPYGFSNDAGRTGAPRFERAAVPVTRDLGITLRLASIAGRR